MPTTFYAVFNDDGSAAGLIRLVQDDTDKTLDLERFNPDGSWTADPSLIDELHESEVQQVDPKQAQQVQQSLLAGAEPSDDELASPDVETAAAADG